MNTSLNLAPRAFPSRIAELGFSAQLPVDWISHELPAEEPDFSNPATFVPLAVITAPHSAIVFAFAARPAYDDGTLHDWAMYLLEHNQLKPCAIGAHQVGSLAAVVGEATQNSDVGPMVVRFAFCEDGNRLINITLTAPELLADTVVNAWFTLLQSFALETPRGSRFTAESLNRPAASPAVEAEVASQESASADESTAVPEPAPVPEPEAEAGADWWRKALALEAENRLDEAEAAISNACQHIGCAASTAELYRRRMLRLKHAGDEAGALAAFQNSSSVDFFLRQPGNKRRGRRGSFVAARRVPRATRSGIR
jgi:hypothetical protein